MKILKSIIFFAAIIIFCNNLFAQDTLKVMHYNLLYYGKNVYDCNDNSNNIDDKNEYLKTVIQYVRPDIFSVNELDGRGDYPIEDDATYLLENALNVDGISNYRKTDFPEIYLANTVFYNYEKLTLKRHYPLSFYYSGLNKIFNVYQFYFNAEDLSTTNDTVFVTCIVAHLKAGNGSDSKEQREVETEIIMNYLKNSEEPGNILLLGDLNLYTPTEDAFQNLINPDYPDYAFNDPADQIGEWHENNDYRHYHSQSTHTGGDCFSSGGMDDRFDFIMASNDIIDGTKELLYIHNSYNTIGQDGSSFNGSLNTTSNSSVPNEIAQALYNMSDHLPVYIELKVNQAAASLNISNIYFQPQKPGAENDVTVYADLTDKEDVISELKIKYGFTSENYSYNVAMSPSGNSYSGMIPKQDAGTKMFFKLAGLNDQNEEIISSSEHYYQVSATTDIDSPALQNNIFVMKNPVRNILQITANAMPKQEVLVELISVGGDVKLQKTIFVSEKSNHQISVQHLPAGLYIIKFKGNGGYIYSQKIVIQN